MLMKTLNSLLAAFGEGGLPPFVQQSLIPTWDAYAKPDNTPRDRVIRVLGFLHLLDQAGVRVSVPKVPTRRVDKLYEALLQEELAQDATFVATHMRKLGVLNVCSVFKTTVRVEREMRGGYNLTMTLALTPRRSESLDSALSKLQGLLYSGDLPVKLQERWKRLPPKSVARNKSDLPKYSEFAAAPPVMLMPLVLEDQRSLYAARARDGFLILKYSAFKPQDSTPWLQPARKHKLVESLFKKSFSNLRS